MAKEVEQIRLGVIGLGNMGSDHCKRLIRGEAPNVKLTAVCDIRKDRLDAARGYLDDSIGYFEDAHQLMESGLVDAVIIAVPHYDHPPLAIAAFGYGLHVLTEKPAGVYTKQVREMNEAAKKSGKVFGIMYNQRTIPAYQKMREMIQGGELGELQRFSWIITDWYRPQYYHDSGDWRSTWAGEGGGVLINQCPHNLDLWQWITGMPKRIRANVYFGKHYNIETEDDVTATFEYENGATGTFITTTADVPGTNRLEISGDRGKLLFEGGRLVFYRTRMSIKEFSDTNRTQAFGSPEVWRCDIPTGGYAGHHTQITQNFAEAILYGKELLAPGYEGINGLTLSNAMHLSQWTDSWVEIPFDEELYYQLLMERVKTSGYKKGQEAGGSVNSDMSGTF